MTDAEAAYHADWNDACDAHLVRLANIHACYKRGEITRAETEVSLKDNYDRWREAQEKFYRLLGEGKARCR